MSVEFNAKLSAYVILDSLGDPVSIDGVVLWYETKEAAQRAIKKLTRV